MANLGWVDRAVGSVGDWSAALTAPQATLITGLTVLVIGGGTVAQKFRNDKRDQWWKRAQRAIELALDPEDNLRQVSGLAAITHLASRSEETSSDRLLLWKIVTAQQELYGGDTRFRNSPHPVSTTRARTLTMAVQVEGALMTRRQAKSSRTVVRDSATGRYLVRTEAARARVVLDKKLGKTTPQEIVDLAKKK